MKRNIFLFSLLITTCSVFPQTIEWDYPVKPGTSDWKLLHNQSAKVQACQIPNDILTSIASDYLINLYLKYPLLFNILSFSTFENGMSNLKSNFNGYNELCLRPDVPNLLLNRYLSMSMDDPDPNWSIFRKGSFTLSAISLELLLSQHDILQKLNYNDQKILLVDAITKFDAKSKNVQVHDYLGLKSSSLLIVKILQEFNLSKHFTDPESINLLISFSNSTATRDDDKLVQIIQLGKGLIPNL